MRSDGEVKIRINVHDGNAPKVIRGLDNSLKDLQGSGDQAGDSMGKLGNQTGNAEGSAKKATGTFRTSAAALVAARVATLALNTAKASMDRAFARLDTMENFERTLLRIYDGNQRTVDQILSGTNDIVIGTAFALDTAARHVQGFIVSGKRQWEQAASDVGIWGDAVAFYGDGSSEQFDRVLRDLVSMSSKGVVRMGDLTNAVAAGIPVYDIYAEATGQTVAEVQRSFTAGQVSAEEFLDVMNASFTEGVDGFVAIEGAAREAGGSWANTFGNFATAVARGTASIISDVDDAFGETRWGSMRDTISRSGKVFENVLRSVGQIASSTVIFIDRYTEALIGVGAAFGVYKTITKFRAATLAATKAVQAATSVERVRNSLTMVTASVQTIANDKLSLGTIILGRYTKALTAAQFKTALNAKATKALAAAKLLSGAAMVTGNAIMATGKIAATALSVAYGAMTGQLSLVAAKTALSTTAKVAWSAVTAKATAIQWKQNAAVLANPLFWKAAKIAAGIGSVVTVLGLLTRRLRETTEEGERMAKEISSTTSNVERLSGAVEDGRKSFEDNSNSVEANRIANNALIRELEVLQRTENKSAVQKEKMAIMVDQLNGSMEGLNLELDRESGLLNMTRDQLIEKTKAYANQEQSVLIQEQLVEALRQEAEIDLELEKIIRQRAELELLLENEEINKREMKKLNAELDETERELIDTKQILGNEQRILSELFEESLDEMASNAEESVDRQITSWQELESTHSYVADKMKETYKMFADVATTSDRKVFDSQDLLVQKTDDNGKAIAGSYYELEESIRQSIDNVLEVKEHNIRVAEEWGTNLGAISERACDSVVSEMTRMAQESPEMAFKMANASEEQFARFEDIARNRSEAASNAMNNKLGEGYDDVVKLTSDMMGNELPDTLTQVLNDAGFGEAGAEIPEEIADGMRENQEALEVAGEELSSNTVDAVSKSVKDGGFKEVGESIPEEIGDGVETAGPTVVTATSDVVDNANDKAKELQPKFNAVGRDAMSGLANGITSNQSVAIAAASGSARQILRQMQSVLQINSPSRVMRDRVGKHIVEGVAVGIDNNNRLVNRSLNNLNTDMVRATKTGSTDVVKGYDNMGRGLERSLNRWPSFARSALIAVNQVLRTQTNTSNRTVSSAAAEMTRSMSQLTPNFRNIGLSAMLGLNQGLMNGRAQVMNTANSIANQVARTMQNALKINSPSRVMRDEVGKWIPYGIAEGIDSHADKALNSTNDLSKQMIKLPQISAESILGGKYGFMSSSPSYGSSNTSNDNSVTNHYSYEGLMEGATIVWNNKEDIRQTMQEIAWITEREEARL